MLIMAIAQFRLFKICTCIATLCSFFKRLICRSGRGRKLSGDQITLPTTVDFSSLPKQIFLSFCIFQEIQASSNNMENSMKIQEIQASSNNMENSMKIQEVEEWSSWDEDAPTSVKVEGGNGSVLSQMDGDEPDYFRDMAPTIRKTQKIIVKKREPLNFAIPDGSTLFSSRLAAPALDIPFVTQSPELGDLETWQENQNAWEEADDALQAEEVLRQQKVAEREKRTAEQQRKKMEKEVLRLTKKDQSKIGVKLS